MKKTKIVCTVGPTSSDRKTFKTLVEEGLDVARFNFSHGDHQQHKEIMEMVRSVREELGKPVAILMDTKGPEIRLGKVKENIELKRGSSFILTPDEVLGDEQKVQITYEDLYKCVELNDKILIDDGMVGLRVTGIEGKDICTRVEYGGAISTKKGVNAPGVRVDLPAVTDKDYEDIVFGVEQGIDFLAASFIRRASDVLEIRKILEKHGGANIQIISKIENQEGYNNLDEILQVSDGIMVARGDLGVEIPIEEVPIAQKIMIKKCNQMGKPVITATQMLDSMMRNPFPTRAEATDVANAIFDGTDAIMLSGETAAGKYPVQAVRTMATIAKRAESSISSSLKRIKQVDGKHHLHDKVTFAVSTATVETAHQLDAKAIALVTTTGFTAQRVAMHRPEAYIIAITPTEEICRRMSLVRGVYSTSINKEIKDEVIFEEIEDCAKKTGLVTDGDLIVITAGVPSGVSGTTNLMKVRVIGSFVYKGLGAGSGKKTAKLWCVASLDDLKEKVKEGDIVYSNVLDESYEPYLSKVGAIISQNTGYTSFEATYGRTHKVPVVVGIKDPENHLTDNIEVTVNSELGLVHNMPQELA